MLAQRGGAVLAQEISNGVGLLFNFLAVFFIGDCHALQHAREAGHNFAPIAPVVGWEVRTGVKGATIGGQEDGHGPATLLGQRLYGLHVEAINIRALFAVYLDADKMLIHEPRDLLVLEGLAFHHMAPVAGGVADAEQDGFIFGPCFFESFLAPGIPVNRIMSMLQQIRACLVNKAVSMFMFFLLYLCRFCHRIFSSHSLIYTRWHCTT